MNVSLVSITQPLIKAADGLRNLTPEELIVYCARVSNPLNQLNTETAPKLINYCIKNSHWSIFEMVDFTVEIQTSRAIAAQILRHKSASFQEFSQRYSSVTEIEPFELRKQGATNRQVGDELVILPELEERIRKHIEEGKELYEAAIKEGVARESARFVLPQAAQTTLYMKNNVRNWIFYTKVRETSHTQKEHRLIAEEIKKIFVRNFPNISTALGWE